MNALVALLTGFQAFFPSLFAQVDMSKYLLSRYVGIVGLAQLDDTEASFAKRYIPWEKTVSDIPPNHPLAKIRFNRVVSIPEAGVRAYLRYNKVALVEIQDPYQGEVQGTHISVFVLKKAKWDQIIQTEFGPEIPKERRGNGRFGSEAFFYSWGDVAFNATGITEIAVYRQGSAGILDYRTKNFGRKLDMWRSAN